ncbi:hypothetical protein SDC9_212500 [bioreactor metagenome]|uniref:Uncharacterized protein n=1 Tax=bioreactor metagenome TaxID=1076179 RepID=A0A645JZ83_9ZZZZ
MPEPGGGGVAQRQRRAGMAVLVDADRETHDQHGIDEKHRMGEQIVDEKIHSCRIRLV